MPAQKLQIHPRLAVKTVQEPLGHHKAEILITGFIHAKQHQMMRLPVHPVHPVQAASRRNIDLAADNRLDACLFRRLIEIDYAIHHAMVRYGDGILPKRFHPFHQLGNPAGAVQETVFRMHMQMNKRHSDNSFRNSPVR